MSQKEVKQLERMVLLQSSCKQDYMTKLDLIDQYPSLFTNNGSLMSKDEIEQLRILVTAEKKLFMSRKPSDRIMGSKQFKRLQKQMLPGIIRMYKNKYRKELEARVGVDKGASALLSIQQSLGSNPSAALDLLAKQSTFKNQSIVLGDVKPAILNKKDVKFDQNTSEVDAEEDKTGEENQNGNQNSA